MPRLSSAANHSVLWQALAAGLPDEERKTRREREMTRTRGFLDAAPPFIKRMPLTLLSAWHAIGFYTQSAPSPALIQAVSATHRVRGRRVRVSVRSTAALQGIRAVVQVGAVCGGGS